MKNIYGAGGKGGGSKPKTPTEQRDNLFSTAYLNILDLISEGEIEGFKNSNNSVYLDNTPLVGSDGSSNFENITVDGRPGTQAQSYIPGFDDISNEVSVGVKVTQGTPIVRTVTDTAVNAVKVLVTIPALLQQESDGDIVGTSVRFQIEVQYNGGGYSTAIDDTIRGKTSQPYQKQYSVSLSGQFPVNIRVKRVTADSATTTLSNDTVWTSYTEVVFAKASYPNSAVVALRISSEQFDNVPQRSYLIRGIKVRIPNNGTVDSVTGGITYSGVWSGTFRSAVWTNDPAWCLWDLLTSKRYGLGDHITESQLDKWSFYAASQYCSTLVPDGFGGYEPRFSCNVNIQSASEAYEVIQQMCSVFRAMPYWGQGAIALSQDRLGDPVHLFTNANVEEGRFSYSNSSLKTRPNVAVVQYMDLDTRDAGYEIVEDQALIAKYGVIRQDIQAFACTSRGQANRLGKWLIYSENNEKDVCAFTSSLSAGALVRPGAIIKIEDQMKNGSRRGGRIVSATVNSITVDDGSQLVFAAGNMISAIMPDGSVEIKTVSSISYNTVNVLTPFSVAPNVNSVWVYETTLIPSTLWRVLRVEEDEQSGGIKYKFSCVSYNPSKYDYIEQGLALQKRKIVHYGDPPNPPTNLKATEVFYQSTTGTAFKIIVSWDSTLGINSYRFAWRLNDDNWESQTITGNSYEILNAKLGTYQFSVIAINSFQKVSRAANLTYEAFGDTSIPSTPTGLNIVSVDENNVKISWTKAVETGVLNGGSVLIRHSSATTGATWETSQEITTPIPGTETERQVPYLSGTYLLKFENKAGFRSVSAASVASPAASQAPHLLVKQFAEQFETPPFSGIYTNMVYRQIENKIELVNATAIDSVTQLIDTIGSIDGLGGILATGTYNFNETLSLPLVSIVNARRTLTTNSRTVYTTIDEYTSKIDTWSAIFSSTEVADQVNAKVYIRYATTLSGTPDWTDWQEFVNSRFTGRYFEFNLVAESSDNSQTIGVSAIDVAVELPQRIEVSGVLTTTTAPYNVTFTNAFYQAPSIAITAYNLDQSDHFTITGITATGFTVTFLHGGTALVRSFTYTATGYGGLT